jgi:hypothetical protein
MLAPISDGRRDKGSSFSKLKAYLTEEKDPLTGATIDRGDIVLSGNLLSLDTADLEMMGTAGENKRNAKPVYHFQITWRPGERPTREQWERSAKFALKELGFAEHQYIIVAHDDKAHFHVHFMVNKIHPETYRAHTPYRDMFTLDKAMRELENEQGWSEDLGLYRWDKDQGMAVKNTREEMDLQSERGHRAKGNAGVVEHYKDIPSLQVYIKKAASLEVQGILARAKVEWSDVHRALAKHGLELQKGEHGGYTVLATGTELRCKASEVFRRTFSGKGTREAMEQKLGPWVASTEDDRARPNATTRYERQAESSAKRREQREARERAREELKKRFGAYRTQQRSDQKLYTLIVNVKRSMISTELKQTKKAIRTENIPWQEKRSRLSEAVARSVMEQKVVKSEVMRDRLTQKALTYQEWVIREAQAGDLAAASQLRGWRYTDQRNVNKAEALLASQANAIHLLPGEKEKHNEYDDLMNDRLQELLRNEELARSLKSARWTIDRRTGDVHYTVRGALALVDRGKTISLLNSEESAIVLGLEMAVKKYGTTLNAEGSDQWKERVARIAAKNGVFVQFSDPTMKGSMVSEQMRLDKYGAMAKQLSNLQLKVANDPQAAFQLIDVAAANVFLSGVTGIAEARSMLERLQADLMTSSASSITVKGVFTLEARLRSDDATPTFTVTPKDGKGIQLVNSLKAGSRQMAELSKIEGNSVQTRTAERQRKVRDIGR